MLLSAQTCWADMGLKAGRVANLIETGMFGGPACAPKGSQKD